MDEKDVTKIALVDKNIVTNMIIDILITSKKARIEHAKKIDMLVESSLLIAEVKALEGMKVN